jgi:hypothetical protein
MTTTIKGTVSGGRLELNVPQDWPDGTEVEIHPLPGSMHADSDMLSPEEIAQTLAAMDQIQPFEMTDAEFAAWEAERQSRKELEKAEFIKDAEKLRRMWP